MQSQDKRRIATLAAYAIVLHLLERMIPTPIPWLRLGLANIITLLALIIYGLRTALFISLIRVLLGSLFIGTFLGPGFILSLGGALTSTFAMAGGNLLGERVFSPMGLSLIGAYSHVLTQLFLAYLIFIRQFEAILWVAPFLLTLGLLTGLLNGLICIKVLQEIKG